MSLRYTGQRGVREIALGRVEVWQARGFWPPSLKPPTTSFLLDLNFLITCVSQYEKILNSECMEKERIYIIILLKKPNSLICFPMKCKGDTTKA